MLATSILLLLAALPATAQTETPYTATGWLTGVPVPGILFSNGIGEVELRGNAHTLQVQSTDVRMTGQRLAFADGAYQADGTALVWGTAYQEVGTFDATTNFTATGGLWEMMYRGTMPADNSLQLHIVGRGSGGSIEGWRFEEDLTKAAGAPWDPADPYLYTGTIKPPPVNTNLMLDDFSGPVVGWNYHGAGSYSYTQPNGQLEVTGYWPGVTTRTLVDSYTFGGPSSRPWMVADGQTLETRVDLVNLNASATAAFFVLGNQGGLYAILKGHDFVSLHKWTSHLPWGPITMFSYEKVQLPDSNVVLSLAMTKVNTNLVVTGRVLDKSNPNLVLYGRSFVDTPGADPALTSQEFLDLSGMQLALYPDLAGAPITTANGVVGVFQYNPDGQQPAAVVTFDNLELWKYEVPPLGIGQAVALTWPDVGSYSVEAAPTVQGPWLPVDDAVSPGMKQTTVPAGQPVQFFRLRQAP
jgi:hypothetical protein